MSTAIQNIQNTIDPLRRRYASLSDSERLIVNAVVVVLIAVLVFLLLILPAQRSVTEAQLKLSGKQKLMQWMHENEPLAKMAATGTTSSAKTSQPLQTIVTSTAPALGVTVKRFEPESDDKLRVWLEKVPFDKTMRWLHQLESRYGILISNVSIDAERDQGMVTAKLVLQK
jgi:general secretion pathway protein M